MPESSASFMFEGVEDAFLRGYLRAMIFTESDDSGEPLDKDSNADERVHESLLALATKDCAEFRRRAADPDGVGYTFEDLVPDEVLEDAGSDLWFTRNRHGCGFWDGDWPEPQASLLTLAAKSFGETWIHVGDDGLIYGDA